MATNSDGGIILSVNIDSSEVSSDMKKVVSEINKQVQAEAKNIKAVESVNQAKEKTAQAQQKTEQAVYKTLQAESQALTAEQNLKTAKEGTATASAKTVQEEEKAYQAIAKTQIVEQQVQQAVNDTAISEEKVAQAKEKTAQATTQSAINQQKLAQEIEKGYQAEEKTTQANLKSQQEQQKILLNEEKIKQAKEKTAQAEEKTKQAIIKTEKAQNSLKKATDSVTNAVKKMASILGIAFSVKQLINFSNEASKLASQTEAYLTRMSTLYGESAQDVYDWANANAYALGMAKSTAYAAAAQYGNLFTTFASAQESAKLSIDMLQATAVVASQTGRTYEETFEKIQSGIYGNTRAIDDLGISVRQSSLMQTQAWNTVSQNGAKSWNDLTDAELQQLRVLGIIEQSTAKYGNTVMQTTALTRAQFNAAWTDFKATWGQAINIVLMPILQVVTKILNAATAALSAVLKFFGKELSFSSGTMQEMSGGASDLADGIDKATGSQKALNKEMKKTLAGFDELQILQDNSSDSESGGSGGTGGTGGGSSDIITATPELTITDAEIETTTWDNLLQTLTEIRDIFLSGFWEAFKNADFSGITTSIDGIKTSLTNIWTSPEVTTAIQNFGTSFIYALGQTTGSIASIGTTIATNLLSGFNQYLSENTSFIQQSIAKIFDAGASIYESVGNLWSAFANIFSVFAETNGINLTSNIIGIFSNAVLGIQTLAAQMGADFINFLTQPIIDNQEQLKTTLDGILGFFADITGGIKTLVDDLVQNALSLYDEHISPLIQSITDTVSEMVQIFLDKWEQNIQPLLDQIGTEFKALVEEHLAPMFDKIFEFVGKVFEVVQPIWDNLLSPLITKIWDDFIGVLLDYISNLGERLWKFTENVFTTISDLISDIMDILNGIIDFITGVFTGDWEKAWDGLKSVFKGVLQGVIDLFEGLINLVIDGLNSFVSKLDFVVSTVGEIVGQDWDIPNIPHVKLPRLAKGAVIPANHEFLAVLGDQKHGTNIEAPADLIKQMAMEAIMETDRVSSQKTIEMLKQGFTAVIDTNSAMLGVLNKTNEIILNTGNQISDRIDNNTNASVSIGTAIRDINEQDLIKDGLYHQQDNVLITNVANMLANAIQRNNERMAQQMQQLEASMARNSSEQNMSRSELAMQIHKLANDGKRLVGSSLVRQGG